MDRDYHRGHDRLRNGGTAWSHRIPSVLQVVPGKFESPLSSAVGA